MARRAPLATLSAPATWPWLAIFAADPPSARLLTVEALAAGLLALVGRRVVAGEAEQLPGLADELGATLSQQS